MSHSIRSYTGSNHPSCHVGGHLSRISSHAYGIHHRGSHKVHHGGSNISQRGGTHISKHGGCHISPHRGSHIFHQTGSHISHRGGSNKVHYGGSHISHHGGSHMSHHGKTHKVHHGSHCRAPSVHGGSGGKGISISNHSSFSHATTYGDHHSHGYSLRTHGLFSGNEKETMQHLNDRLSSYLDKVHSLEQENSQLERNIREWYERNQPSATPDFSCYLRTIQELQNLCNHCGKCRIELQIDNALLASDDFRNKYNMERQLGNIVEGEVNGFHILLEELNRERCYLEIQVQNLQTELQQMKRNHEEEVNSLRAQLGAKINVEVDAAPSVDLNRTLSEIRAQYEGMMERNLREVETMFYQRTEELNREVTSGSEQLQSVQTEVNDLRRIIQTLEIELQSQMSMKSSLEGTLAETKATFGSQLAQLQNVINNVESQLTQIRCDLERQNHAYKILMDQKNHLEMEIATYKRLLDGHDIHASGQHFSVGKHGSHHVLKAHHVTSHVHHSKC